MPSDAGQDGSGAARNDNALAESVIGRYKTEVIGPQGPWRHAEQVEFATLTWNHAHAAATAGIG